MKQMRSKRPTGLVELPSCQTTVAETVKGPLFTRFKSVFNRRQHGQRRTFKYTIPFFVVGPFSTTSDCKELCASVPLLDFEEAVEPQTLLGMARDAPSARFGARQAECAIYGC